jgi:Domain of unknown function (DUF1996)
MRLRTPLFRTMLGAPAVVVLACVFSFVETTQSWARSRSKPVKRLPSVAFVVSCAPSHQSLNDPIKHRGHAGMSHRHSFFGNTSTDANSTLSSLTTATTTCNDLLDRAAYWMPAPKVGSWINMRAYYSAGTVDPSAIVSYPPGLAMVTTSPESVVWSCGLGVNDVGWQARPQKCSPSKSLTVRVTFPQCGGAWVDALAGTPADIISAVNGRCPDKRVAYPLLRIRAVWGDAPTTPGDLTLSSGTPETMHADFFNAWDPQRLDRLVSVCVRGERKSNVEITQCRLPGTGPASAS